MRKRERKLHSEEASYLPFRVSGTWLQNTLHCLKKSGLQGRVMLTGKVCYRHLSLQRPHVPMAVSASEKLKFPHLPPDCQSYHCSADAWSHTDLLKPGPDDGYPVLDGGDGVRVADGQDSVPHTGRFIEGSSFFLQFLHEFLQQK